MRNCRAWNHVSWGIRDCWRVVALLPQSCVSRKNPPEKQWDAGPNMTGLASLQECRRQIGLATEYELRCRICYALCFFQYAFIVVQRNSFCFFALVPSVFLNEFDSIALVRS